MALYEMRTYTLYVGKMAEATKLYQELGFPALQKGGHDKKLIGYFQGDTGMINQLVHLWKFEDDADRRKHWAAVFANKDFVEGFASRFRPLVMSDGGTLGSPSLTSSALDNACHSRGVDSRSGLTGVSALITMNAKPIVGEEAHGQDEVRHL